MIRTHRSRRLALVASVLVMGLSACGSSADQSVSNGSPTTVVASTTSAPSVIHLTSGPTGSAGAAASPLSADAEAGRSTKMMVANLIFQYQGAAPDLTGPATAWYFAPGTVPSQEAIAALAAALSVDGDVRVLGEDMGGGFMVGAADFTTSNLTVSGDAMQSWWYSPAPVALDCVYAPVDVPAEDPAAPVDSAGAPSEAVTIDPDATSDSEALPVCDDSPPANVPDEQTATAKATEFFTEVGMDPSQYELEVYADEWQANVTAFLVLDGVRTSVTASVGFGEDGVISWASGLLGTPVQSDQYPRIGVDAAIARLNDQQSMLRTLRANIDPTMDPATIDVVPNELNSAVAPDAASESPAMQPPDTEVDSTGDVLIDQMPADCDIRTDCAPIDQEPVTITLTEATPSLEMSYAGDETVWLLPGYAFESTDGGRYTVNAVPDEFLAYDETPVDVPADTVPAGTEPGVVVPEPATTEASNGEPGTPDDSLVITPEGDEFVGLGIGEATKLAESLNWKIRVVRIDGVDQPATADFQESRYNVATNGGIVTEVVNVG